MTPEKMIFCQSCGMPMTVPEHFGAETDGSPSSETIKRKGKALGIGSGHNSMQRSEIIADKFIFTPDDTHRCGEILTCPCPHQQSIQAVRVEKPLFRSSNSRQTTLQ